MARSLFYLSSPIFMVWFFQPESNSSLLFTHCPFIRALPSGLDSAPWILKERNWVVPFPSLRGHSLSEPDLFLTRHAQRTKDQNFRAIKVNAISKLLYIQLLAATTYLSSKQRSNVRALGLDVSVDFRGRFRKGITRQLSFLNPIYLCSLKIRWPTQSHSFLPHLF